MQIQAILFLSSNMRASVLYNAFLDTSINIDDNLQQRKSIKCLQSFAADV
jgi:hypothetical protein